MIILIGGAPRTGKSTVARQLMKRLELPWISTDALQGVAVKLSPTEERGTRFPFRPFSADEKLTEEGTHQRLAWQTTEAASMRPLLDAFLGSQADGDGYVIEGVHLLPEHVRELMKDDRLNGQLKAAYVLSLDAERQVAAMKGHNSPDDWLRGASDETYRAVADFVVTYSRWLKDECDKHGLPYVERTGDFAAENERLMTMLI